jgi:hypothetical protein
MPAHQAGPRRQKRNNPPPKPPRRIIRASLPLIYLPSRLCSNARDWTDPSVAVEILWTFFHIASPFGPLIEFRCSFHRRFEREKSLALLSRQSRVTLQLLSSRGFVCPRPSPRGLGLSHPTLAPRLPQPAYAAVRPIAQLPSHLIDCQRITPIDWVHIQPNPQVQRDLQLSARVEPKQDHRLRRSFYQKALTAQHLPLKSSCVPSSSAFPAVAFA